MVVLWAVILIAGNHDAWYIGVGGGMLCGVASCALRLMDQQLASEIRAKEIQLERLLRGSAPTPRPVQEFRSAGRRP